MEAEKLSIAEAPPLTVASAATERWTEVFRAIGGGISSPTAPSGTSSSSNLKNAYIALQTWKSSITDDPQRVLETWVGSNVCSYKGIFCADLQNEFHELRTAIVGIDLNYANLQGTLVKELSFLTDLSLLHLNSNRFTGTVPNTFQYLSSLKELDLSDNHFSGLFPTPTLFIPNLLYLNWSAICKEIN